MGVFAGDEWIPQSERGGRFRDCQPPTAQPLSRIVTSPKFLNKLCKILRPPPLPKDTYSKSKKFGILFLLKVLYKGGNCPKRSMPAIPQLIRSKRIPLGLAIS